jgi:hypothetical protein
MREKFKLTNETYANIATRFRIDLLKDLEERLPPIEFDIFEALCNGESVKSVAGRFFGSFPTKFRDLNRIIRKIKRSFLGLSGELIWERIWLEEGHDIVSNRNSPRVPDFIDHTEKEVQIFRVTLLSMNLNRWRITDCEKETALNSNYQLVQIVYSMILGFKKFIILF